MEIPNSFARTLAKLEGRVKKLNMALHNTRHLYELGDQEMTYAVAMRLADTAEQVTLLARALPACTGNPIAAQELQDVMAINVPVEMGFTKEGWFSVRLPLLLPKKEKGFKALEELSKGEATKIIIPSELQGMAGLATSIKEFVSDKPKKE